MPVLTPISRGCAVTTLLLGSLVSGGALAVNVNIVDSCGRTVAGSAGPNSIDGSGNVTLNQFVAPYMGTFGPCDPTPTDGLPRCTLSASRTKVARNEPVTLFAKCTPTPASYLWLEPVNGPPQNPDPPTSRSITPSFPNDGIYTYSVAGSTGSVLGPPSAQVSILVGDSASVPNCVLTASPNVAFTNQQSSLLATCHPEATSYTWSVDGTAPLPATTSAFADVGFNNVGTYTYKVSGTNAIGPGPQASATVTIKEPPPTPALRGYATYTSAGTLAYPAGTQPSDWVIFVGTSGSAPIEVAWTLVAEGFWSGGNFAVYARQAGASTGVVLLHGQGRNILLSYKDASGIGAVGQLIESAATDNFIPMASLDGLVANSLVLGIALDADSQVPVPAAGFTNRIDLTGSGSTVAFNAAERAYPASSSTTGSVVWTQAGVIQPGAGILIEILR